MAINYEELYAGIGYLFYSISACDGNVHPKEVEKLKEMIKNKWLDYEDSTDEFGTDAGHYIQFAFDLANMNEMDYKEAYDRFKTHHDEHGEDYVPQLNKLIMQTSEAIADVFHQKNKSELTLLTSLSLLLRDKPGVKA
jgi:hypothetical protein